MGRSIVLNEKGAVMAIIVIVGTIITILALAAINFAGLSSQQMGRMRSRSEALYAAKAGVEVALFGLRNKTSDSLAGIVAPDGVNSARFNEGARYLDLDTVELTTARGDNVGRKTVRILVEEDGTTADGLRKRYKLTSQVAYASTRDEES